MAAANPDCDYGDNEDHEDSDDNICSEDRGGSVATARSLRQARGIFEAEICCGEELDLHRHLDSCEKNPGHSEFIPVGEFTVNHLPHRYRYNDIAEFIKALADITVHISVKYTSPDRPDCYPDSDIPYPAQDIKGRSDMRTGSGWVTRVTVHSRVNYRNKTCPCQKCKNSLRPEVQWAFIDIYTATHLVYDEKEGANTICRFFYDSNDIMLEDTPSLRGATRVHIEFDGDACRMTYITHDIMFANNLSRKWRLYKSLHTGVGEKYNTNNNDGQVIPENDHKLTVIVSHPHGCSKQISVGEYVKRDEMDYNDVYTKYTYTTPTCPGCSGAPVYILSRWWWWGCDHPHGGQCEENKNLNYSGIAMY